MIAGTNVPFFIIDRTTDALTCAIFWISSAVIGSLSFDENASITANLFVVIRPDESKLNELELVFNTDHEGVDSPNYEKEAAELMKRYNSELTKQKIATLSSKLEELDENSEEYLKIVSEITNLQKT